MKEDRTFCETLPSRTHAMRWSHLDLRRKMKKQACACLPLPTHAHIFFFFSCFLPFPNLIFLGAWIYLRIRWESDSRKKKQKDEAVAVFQRPVCNINALLRIVFCATEYTLSANWSSECTKPGGALIHKRRRRRLLIFCRISSSRARLWAKCGGCAGM